MTKVLINRFNRIEKAGEYAFRDNHEKTYGPVLKLMLARAEYGDSVKGKGSRELMLAWDVKNGIRNADGDYMITLGNGTGGRQAISKLLALAVIPEKELLAIPGSTVLTVYANHRAALKASGKAGGKAGTNNASNTAKNTARADTAALTRTKKIADDAGFKVISAALKLLESDAYLAAIENTEGTARIDAARKFINQIGAAVLKDFDLKPAALQHPAKPAATKKAKAS